MHSGTLVNRPGGLIISSLGSFAFLMLNRISDFGYKGRIHLPPSKTSKSNFRQMLGEVVQHIFISEEQPHSDSFTPKT